MILGGGDSNNRVSLSTLFERRREDGKILVHFSENLKA